ncbi:MAG: glycosyltransferase family 2 protein [Planctomycetota bacterium]|jgi:glycosyltransferase involved in cell wall biosynthesis
MPRWLAAIPVFNEVSSVQGVLDEVTKYAPNVLAVDDGSSDGTSELLDRREDIAVAHHSKNLGYGAALRTAFQYAIDEGYEILVTLDCDGQHQPKRIPRFVAACKNADIVSGSRYLKTYEGDSAPPAERLFINRTVTKRLNETFGWNLTDTFCGFKAYRVSALEQLRVTVDGYAMPLELWVQAAYLGLRIIEIPVPLIYLDLSRSFGGSLDDGGIRLQHYNSVIDASIRDMLDRGYGPLVPASACRGECC